MEVILLKNDKKLGKAGVLVHVPSGYAQNYLLPKGIAKIATAGNKKHMAQMLKQFAKKDAKLKEEAMVIKEQLAKITLELQVKTSDAGKIFGTVTPSDIKNAIASHQIDIHANQIRLLTTIKEVGAYNIEVILHPEVSLVVKCNVVAA